jgi:hypothetical protein
MAQRHISLSLSTDSAAHKITESPIQSPSSRRIFRADSSVGYIVWLPASLSDHTSNGCVRPGLSSAAPNMRGGRRGGWDCRRWGASSSASIGLSGASSWTGDPSVLGILRSSVHRWCGLLVLPHHAVGGPRRGIPGVSPSSPCARTTSLPGFVLRWPLHPSGARTPPPRSCATGSGTREEEGLRAIDLDMSGCDVGSALAIGFVVEGLDEGAVGTCCTKSGPFDYDPMVSIAH